MNSHGATNPTVTTSPPPLTVNSSSSTNGNGDGMDLVSGLWIFGAPVIFVIGVCGNALVLDFRVTSPQHHSGVQ